MAVTISCPGCHRASKPVIQEIKGGSQSETGMDLKLICPFEDCHHRYDYKPGMQLEART